MLVTPSGISMLTRLVQSRNASVEILITGNPSTTSGITISPLMDVSQYVIVALLFETVYVKYPLV